MTCEPSSGPCCSCAGGLGKKRSGTQGAELLPLNSLPIQPANNNKPGSLQPGSLFGRITATIGGGRSVTKDSLQLANEV